MTAHRRLVNGLALLTLAVASCGVSTTRTLGGAVVINGRAHYLLEERTSRGGEGTLVELDCATATASSTVDCVARTVVIVPPPAHTSGGPRSEVIAAAAGCPADQIEIQSGDETNGYWLWACGRQRFFRRVVGTWVDVTPAPETAAPPTE